MIGRTSDLGEKDSNLNVSRGIFYQFNTLNLDTLKFMQETSH